MTSTVFNTLLETNTKMPLEEITLLVHKYPSSSLLQVLYYKNISEPTVQDINRVGIYKNNDFSFVTSIYHKQYITEQSPKIIEAKQKEEENKAQVGTKIVAEEAYDILADIHLLKEEKATSLPEGLIKEKQNNINNKFINNYLDVDNQSLMQMMSFADWLQLFAQKRKQEQEEQESKNQLRAHIQKEKLAAALDEDSDVIPEPIFNQAMNSITDNEIISEALAEILVKQDKKQKAAEMYRKLSLRNPEKSSYFAKKIKDLSK